MRDMGIWLQRVGIVVGTWASVRHSRWRDVAGELPATTLIEARSRRVAPSLLAVGSTCRCASRDFPTSYNLNRAFHLTTHSIADELLIHKSSERRSACLLFLESERDRLSVIMVRAILSCQHRWPSTDQLQRPSRPPHLSDDKREAQHPRSMRMQQCPQQHLFASAVR